MLEALIESAQALPTLLETPGIWKSLYIDYHPPFVERAYCDFKNWRINLHRIHPVPDAGSEGGSESQVALYHPHPWPSAMLIVGGAYEMRTGYGSPTGEPPPMGGRILLTEGAMYEMVDPREWHYVKPSIGLRTHTIMVTGKPYPDRDQSKKPTKELRSLTDEELGELLDYFRAMEEDGNLDVRYP
jgi:hypothetical protein